MALVNFGSMLMPTRAAASAHCVLRFSVGATIVTRSMTPRPSSSVATRNAKVVLPAPGVATARKSRGASSRYCSSAVACQARSLDAVPQAARSGNAGERWDAAAVLIRAPTITKSGRRHAEAPPSPVGPRGVLRQALPAPRQRSVLAVLRGAQAFVDLLADGADGELLGVAPRHPDLAAERHHGLAGQGALEDLLLAHVVREAFVVARLLDLLLDLLSLEHGCRRGRPGRLRLRRVGVTQRDLRVGHVTSLSRWAWRDHPTRVCRGSPTRRRPGRPGVSSGPGPRGSWRRARGCPAAGAGRSSRAG